MPATAPVTPPRSPRRVLPLAASLIFLAYAGCFLYFFVDDEAIPLVYARNLLRGRGLVYTTLEGRVEGYSDFLHVLWSAVLLAITRALGWSPVAPMLVGKVVSLAAGVAIIYWTSRTLRRHNVSAPAEAAALVFLALAGPLAVWSASSLETTTVALTVAAFAAFAWEDRFAPAVVLGILLVLERIDGPVYVSIALAAGLAARPAAWRALTRIGALVALAGAAFHLWRWRYFGSLLSAPLAAKVLYRLEPPPHAVIKPPAITYFWGLQSVYGWAGLAILLLAAVAVLRHPSGRASLAVLLGLGWYAERVDDWMFGWRFAVAMAPFMAVILALAADRVPARARRLAAGALCLWSVLAARTFIQDYERSETRPLFWLAPRGGESTWFGRYYELVTSAQRIVHHGDRIAYNQAGLVPYLLDVENLDDLGICSSFVARLPTTDVYYTGVGRYSPMTDTPIVRTAHAYLLYHDVQVIIEPADLLEKANHDRIPDTILDGLFRRADTGLRENAIYRRTDRSAERFARDPSAFTENLVHVSRVHQAAIDGHVLSDLEVDRRLRFLREQQADETFVGSREIAVTFARHDTDAFVLFVGGLSMRHPGTLTATLQDEHGREVHRIETGAGPGPTSLLEALPPGTRATTLVLVGRGEGDERLTLTDVRVLGQTPALRDYIRRNLTFPAR